MIKSLFKSKNNLFLVIFSVAWMVTTNPFTYREAKDRLRERVVREKGAINPDMISLIDEMAYQFREQKGEGNITQGDLDTIYAVLFPAEPAPAAAAAEPAAAPAWLPPAVPVERPFEETNYTYSVAIDILVARLQALQGEVTADQNDYIIPAVQHSIMYNERLFPHEKGNPSRLERSKRERLITQKDLDEIFESLYALTRIERPEAVRVPIIPPAVLDSPYYQYLKVVKTTLDKNDRSFSFFQDFTDRQKVGRVTSIIGNIWMEYDHFRPRVTDLKYALWHLCDNSPEDVRVIFLADLADRITQKYPARSHKYITITDFGAGEGFMGYLLAQELLKEGYEEVFLNLIDTAYVKDPPMFGDRFNLLRNLRVKTYRSLNEFLSYIQPVTRAIKEGQAVDEQRRKESISHVFMMVDSSSGQSFFGSQQGLLNELAKSERSFNSVQDLSRKFFVNYYDGFVRFVFEPSAESNIIDLVRVKWANYFSVKRVAGEETSINNKFIDNFVVFLGIGLGFLYDDMLISFENLVVKSMVSNLPVIVYRQGGAKFTKTEIRADAEPDEVYDQISEREGHRVFKPSGGGELIEVTPR